jgi:hypothetical protein
MSDNGFVYILTPEGDVSTDSPEAALAYQQLVLGEEKGVKRRVGKKPKSTSTRPYVPRQKRPDLFTQAQKVVRMLNALAKKDSVKLTEITDGKSKGGGLTRTLQAMCKRNGLDVDKCISRIKIGGKHERTGVWFERGKDLARLRKAVIKELESNPDGNIKLLAAQVE